MIDRSLMMLYTLVGFGLAALFGMLAYRVLGLEGLMHSGWVDPVFLGLMVAGVVLDHQASFRRWFGRQPQAIQNLVAAAGFTAVGLAVTVLLRDAPWTWHIPG
jgi:hypothetical protein